MSGVREKGVWYVLEAGPYNQALVGLSRDEIADWAVSLGKAVARQERGINAFADDLMDERERYLETRRETGKLGGRPPKKGHPGVTPGSPAGHGGAVPNRTQPNPTMQNMTGLTHRSEVNLDAKPEPTKPDTRRGGVGGADFESVLRAGNSRDRYALIASIPHEKLAESAAAFCNEEDPNRAIAVYKRIIRTIGPEAFRAEWAAFAGECEAGEEPHNRGAAFMARVKRLHSEKIERMRKEGE